MRYGSFLRVCLATFIVNFTALELRLESRFSLRDEKINGNYKVQSELLVCILSIYLVLAKWGIQSRDENEILFPLTFPPRSEFHRTQLEPTSFHPHHRASWPMWISTGQVKLLGYGPNCNLTWAWTKIKHVSRLGLDMAGPGMTQPTC